MVVGGGGSCPEMRELRIGCDIALAQAVIITFQNYAKTTSSNNIRIKKDHK